MKSKYEIERKWILKAQPELPVLAHSIVHQSYLYVSNDVEVRVVKRIAPESADSMRPTIIGQKFTVKIGNGLSREEIEFPLTENQVVSLQTHMPPNPIIKDFFLCQLPDGRELHYSHVDPGSPTEFKYAEIEFSSEEEANNYTLPPELTPFIEREVTGGSFGMKNYWNNTRK